MSVKTNQPHLNVESNSSERPRRVQLFRVSSLHFGVFETEIATIADWREPTPLPHAPDSVLGVATIQGRMLTVLHLAILSNAAATPDNEDFRFILALRGDEQLALAVTDLAEITQFTDSELKSPAQSDERFVLGVLAHPGGEAQILNPAELFLTAFRGRERRRRRF